MSQPISTRSKGGIDELPSTLQPAFQKKVKKSDLRTSFLGTAEQNSAFHEFPKGTLFKIKSLIDLENLLGIGLNPFEKNDEGQSILHELLIQRSMTQYGSISLKNPYVHVLQRTYATFGSEYTEVGTREMFIHLSKKFPELLQQTFIRMNASFENEDALTVFQGACYYHQLDLLKPKKEDFVSKTALGISAFGLMFLEKQPNIFRKYSQIELALELGINPNGTHFGSMSISVLHHAILHFDPKLVQLLLSYGHEPDITDLNGNTPLKVIENYEERNFRRKYTKEQAPIYFWKDHKERLNEIVPLLLESGARLSEGFKGSARNRTSEYRKNLIRIEEVFLKELEAKKLEAFSYLHHIFKGYKTLSDLVMSYFKA